MRAPRRQRGVSLVEWMVGLALGLLVVAAATALLASRLKEHRALLVEARLMQDLRASVDLVVRDLRRAGYWGNATASMWRADVPATVANPYAALAPAAAASDAVSFRFSRDDPENDAVDGNEQFGFRLRNGVIQILLGSDNWQALTDSTTMTVLAFSVTPLVQEIALRGACEKTCPGEGDACLPRQQVRSLAVEITGRSTADASVVRSVRSNVRVRNDAVIETCPT